MQDMDHLLASLEENALQGVETLPNVRKIRFAITGKTKGKSGGARLIIYVRIKKERIYCLYVYDKADIASIPDHELKAFVKELIEDLAEEDEKEEN